MLFQDLMKTGQNVRYTSKNDREFAKVFILFHGLLLAGCCNGYRRISFVSQHFSADNIRISATKGKNVSP